MPLARGTAAVGYLTLLAVFMAAGMPIEANIPEVTPSIPPCLQPHSAQACPPSSARTATALQS